MTRSITLSLLLLLSCTGIYAQHTEKFELDLPVEKIKNSLYNTISFLDSRSDTTTVGIIQTGAFNRRTIVVPARPFRQQLTAVLNAFTDSTAAQGELLFNLRQFSFAEITGAVSEKGYCYLRAELYAKNAAQYQKLGMVDTVLLIRGIDVTNGLLRRGSNLVTGLIARNLATRPNSASDYYSFNDVVHIDSI
ncbi:MAG: hypothetical protein ABIN95_02015, partial [Mucilaginibacter sp.]